MSGLTHISASGEASMVDVSEKDVTARVAVAEGCVVMQPETLDLITSGNAKKGDVLFWHPRLLHRGSTPNDFNLERRALISHYSGINHRPDFPTAVPVGKGWIFPIGA